MRPLTSIPRVTAGLIWQPEIGPTAKAMASRDSPNAMATPTLPTFPPAITAVVNPAKTRTNVPNNSAAYFMRLSPQGNFGHHLCPRSKSVARRDRLLPNSSANQFEMSAGILHGKGCFRTYQHWCHFLSDAWDF